MKPVRRLAGLAVLGAVLLAGAAPSASREPVSYGSFEAARDSAEAILRSVLGAYADSAAWSRDSVDFLYRQGGQVLSQRVPGFSFAVQSVSADSVSFGAWNVFEAFRGRGWTAVPEYSGAGAEGLVEAVWCREALCEITVTWSAIGEGDTSSASSGLWIDGRCVPAKPARSP